MRDRDVRNAVWQKLTTDYAQDEDTRLVQEMGIWSGSVRIDIAVINGELSGFELKSDRDTLERLPFQAEIYSKVFDRLTLVVGSRHVTKAAQYIPDWWGITIATETSTGVGLNLFRDAANNPTPDPYLIAQLLWKSEALAVLDKFNLAKGWKGKRIKQIHQRLSTELPLEVLSLQVRTVLKNRPEWLRQIGSSKLDMTIYSDSNPVF